MSTKKKTRRPQTTLTFQSYDSGHEIGSATKIIILKLNSQQIKHQKRKPEKKINYTKGSKKKY